jgi:hypothetical protein
MVAVGLCPPHRRTVAELDLEHVASHLTYVYAHYLLPPESHAAEAVAVLPFPTDPDWAFVPGVRGCTWRAPSYFHSPPEGHEIKNSPHLCPAANYHGVDLDKFRRLANVMTHRLDSFEQTLSRWKAAKPLGPKQGCVLV